MNEKTKELLEELYKIGFKHLVFGLNPKTVRLFNNFKLNIKPELINNVSTLAILDKVTLDDIVTYLKKEGYEDGEVILLENLFEILNISSEKIVSTNDYKIFLEKRRVYKNDREITLTTKEYDLLAYMLSRKGTAIDREQIWLEVWKTSSYGSDRVVDDTLRRLRKKMPEINIRTIYGFGYRYD